MEGKEDIKRVLKLLSEKLKLPENKELMDQFLLDCGVFETEGLNDSAFVRLQRKVLRQKSKAYYKNIKDDQLKKELIESHSQMLWYRTINDLEKYFLYVNYQVENMLNYYIRVHDSYTKIENNPSLYSISATIPNNRSNKPFVRNIDCYTYFFDNKKNRNKVSKIGSLWAKLLFWSIDHTGGSKFIIDQHSNLSAIIDIRNEQNHADYKKQKNSCDYWYEQEDGFSLAFIEAILKTIRNSIL